MRIDDEALFGRRRGIISIVAQEELVSEIVAAYNSLESDRSGDFEALLIRFLGTYCGLRPADMLALFSISRTLENREYAMKLQFVAATMFDMFVREAKRDNLTPLVIDARFLAAQEIFEAAQASFDAVYKNERGHPIAVALRSFCSDLRR